MAGDNIKLGRGCGTVRVSKYTASVHKSKQRKRYLKYVLLMVIFTASKTSWCKWAVGEDRYSLFKKGLDDSEQQAVTSFYLCVYLWPFPGSYTFTLPVSFSVLCSLKTD